MSEIKKVFVNSKGIIVPPSPRINKLPVDVPKRSPAVPKPILVTLEKKTRVSRKAQGVNGHWNFDGPLCDCNQFGFIYLIEDTVNKKMYIGKKQFFGTGKENRGQETNWKWYTSSSKALNAAIQKEGKEAFNFYVLDQYRIRGTLGYAETWSLMCVETPCNQDKWYNGLVNKISWTVKENVSHKHKSRLNLIVAGQGHLLEAYNADMA